MQCPKCGSLNPDNREQCGRCGALLSETMSASVVPDWRKEVTKKVKAYGDRKKSLTTPPGPIKERSVALDDMPESAPVLEERNFAEEESKPVVEPAKPSIFQRKQRDMSQQPQPPRWPVANQNPAPAPAPDSQPRPRKLSEEIDIWKDDLLSAEIIEEKDQEPHELRGLKEASRKLMLESDSEQSRVGESYLWRRTVAFLIDNLVLSGGFAALVYGYSALMQDDVIPLVRAAWPSICELFLLVHFLYYLYFYSTSRQTPGQVFFSIELRDSGGGPDIPFHKILVRWLSMVLFNLLNLLPLLFGKTQLLMDLISGTEIRALK